MSLRLPAWSVRELAWIDQQKGELEKLYSTVKDGSGRFREACNHLLSKSQDAGSNGVRAALAKPIDVRACAYLWETDPSFAAKVKPSPALLKRMEEITPDLTALTLASLLSIYFRQFDELSTTEGLAELKRCLAEQLTRRARNDGASEFGKLASHAELLFSDRCIEQTVESASQSALELQNFFETVGLNSYSDGRFAELCRSGFYLRQLESIEVGEDSPILFEVSKKDIVVAPYDRQRFGHKVIQILIDRSLGLDLSDAWRETILQIAGDPRLSESSAGFQTWWEPLGAKRVNAMKAWMSQLDVALFLEILSEVGKQSDNDDLKRMFPARRALLAAILNSGRVINSRLFLSRQARAYVRRAYPDWDPSLFGDVKDRDKSVIYLQVGSLHLVEGTHNFKLWIYPELPQHNAIFSESRRAVDPGELGQWMKDRFDKEYPGREHEVFSKTHVHNLSWITDAIRYLQNAGIRVDENDLKNEKQVIRQLVKRKRREDKAELSHLQSQIDPVIEPRAGSAHYGGPKSQSQHDEADPSREDLEAVIAAFEKAGANVDPNTRLRVSEIAAETGLPIATVRKNLRENMGLFKIHAGNRWGMAS